MDKKRKRIERYQEMVEQAKKSIELARHNIDRWTKFMDMINESIYELQDELLEGK